MGYEKLCKEYPECLPGFVILQQESGPTEEEEEQSQYTGSLRIKRGKHHRPDGKIRLLKMLA